MAAKPPHGKKCLSTEESQLDYEIRRFGRSRRGERMNRFEREVTKHILSKIPANSLVADVPCGMGRFSDLVIEQGHRYLGLDINFAYTQYAATRLKKFLLTGQASILDLPLADNSVDLILSIRIFHHFQSEQIEQALKEISRVSPRALITYYNRNTWRIQRRRFSSRLRRRQWQGGDAWDKNTYCPQDMAALAEKAGLQIKERIPPKGFFSFTTNHFLYLERMESPST